jgi:adenosylhomocysteine nucleosidase
MPVGLICAIPEEFAPLRAMVAHPRTVAVAGIEFVSGALDGREVVLAASAIGKVNGALVTTLLADRFGCAPIVFSGVAGGLDPSLAVGDVVIADRVIQHDAGVLEDGRLTTYQAGRLPFIDPSDELGFTVDADLAARVRQRLSQFALPALSAAAGGAGDSPRIVHGTVLSGDQFLRCDTTRDQWHRRFHGLAVEMEGGAVAQVAAAFGVPWLVVRALSDLAGQTSSIDFRAFVDEVATSSVAIVRRLLPVL